MNVEENEIIFSSNIWKEDKLLKNLFKVIINVFIIIAVVNLWKEIVLSPTGFTVCNKVAVIGIEICIILYVLKSLSKRDYERIKIVYHSDIEKLKRINIGDWIDLRAAEDVSLKKGEFKFINLGVSMKLPDGYEAHVVPRSSTYKNYKIIQTNHCGIIDNSYSGTNDVWMYPALATEDTIIRQNDRICQFRIVKSQPTVCFIETDVLDEKDRGGFGSTGK